MTPASGVRARVESGEQLVGMFVQLRDPAGCEAIGHLGLDVLCIEGEHSAVDVVTVERLVAATQLTRANPIVRVAANDPIAIASALDAGAAGVIVPRVSSGPEARAAVAAARYPPIGQRGIGPSRATRYGAEIAGYRRQANLELLLSVQVETREAVERLDEVLSEDGVDLVFVGPGDLASSLGIEEMRSPELREMIETILTRTHQAGRRSGVFATNVGDARRWHAAGASLVIVGSDLVWLAHSVSGFLAEIRGDRP